MIRFLLLYLVMVLPLFAAVPIVPKSVSPDGSLHAVMDIDRDPTIKPSWKAGGEHEFAQIEITERDTGKVVHSISYFGDPWSDQRPLREKVKIYWRSDSKAFGITIHDRFYSSCLVYVANDQGRFVSVAIPSYKELTGFDPPDTKHLRPRGRNMVAGWDKQGHLIYEMFLSPDFTFKGNDPLRRKVFLKVQAHGMTRVGIDQDQGEWVRGDWISKDDPGGK